MTYEYTNYPTLKDNMLPCHEYYPIPDKEVVYSGGALDNKPITNTACKADGTNKKTQR